MKKIILILIVLLSVSCNASQPVSLVEALITVESNGNDSAIGDEGRAVGCLQIWKITVDDCNRILKSNRFSYKDRLDRKKSIEMFRIYTGHYAVRRRLGKSATKESIARIWNGGPNGFKKPATIKYWTKVRILL